MLVLPVVMDIKYVFLAFSLGDCFTGLIGMFMFWVLIYRKYLKIDKMSENVKEEVKMQSISVETVATRSERAKSDVLCGDQIGIEEEKK